MPDLQWRVGDVEVFGIVETDAARIIQCIIKEATPENINEIGWLYPHFADRSGKLIAVVQTFLIRSNGRHILIDTGVGNDKNRTDVPEWANLRTDFLGSLEQIGVTAADIDIVACTHLHVDHVGWNTRLQDGEWVPAFSRARYVFSRAEYDYWVQKPENEASDHKAAFDDSVTPVVEAGLAELVDVRHALDGSVRFLPTPGHSPAHVSVLIESRGRRAVISGDALHHPCQIARPEWSTTADTSPQKAAASRLKLLDQLADTDTLLIGSHFAAPAAGRVVRRGGRSCIRGLMLAFQ